MPFLLCILDGLLGRSLENRWKLQGTKHNQEKTIKLQENKLQRKQHQWFQCKATQHWSKNNFPMKSNRKHMLNGKQVNTQLISSFQWQNDYSSYTHINEQEMKPISKTTSLSMGNSWTPRENQFFEHQWETKKTNQLGHTKQLVQDFGLGCLI